ncbi:MAG: hypothetical protein UX80_C0006G0010 [Candidatus Amesbacteria bacterium GW2011_GWA2_47_11b]|uniref:Uncharacterized protein n=1 Tax=Candidatus Amesbacteria bacterium GW2011_GWA2_47_11b TaxID=1618358 RepID=A0A0G1UJZ5_9BACT|nr:MAG: hypothetical protein UX42_C0003G0007 [Microgenomates group bacterium GW2011_GWC1_46_20]KKU58040.1 MAG: hypothetical protein UX80_C0006G0010 [Candidatus Amesbacteria bacterium GW2011_GWA2_47_11b]
MTAMTRKKRPISSLIIALLAWMGVGLTVWKLPPVWWSEMLVIGLLSLALVLTVAWGIGKRKLGVMLALAIVGLLLMQRFRILDWTTVGLWLVVVGLISLVN